MDGVIGSDATALELLHIVDERYNNPKDVWGIPFSGSFGEFPILDKMSGGIQNLMHVLVSRPGYGKSAMAAQFAANAAEHVRDHMPGRKVFVITSEMAPTAYQRRMACTLSEVDNKAAKNGFANYRSEHERTRDRAAFVDAVNYIGTLPIVFKSGDVSVDDIVRLVIGEGDRHNPEGAFWILDHIGLVNDTSGPYGTRNLVEVSKRLRNFSQNCVGGLILGHIGRGQDDGRDKEPTQERVAGTDQIPRDADWLFAIHRFDKAGKQNPEEKNAPVIFGKLMVLKARDDSDDSINLRFKKACTKWSESKELNRR